jgi:hypothetical protein
MDSHKSASTWLSESLAHSFRPEILATKETIEDLMPDVPNTLKRTEGGARMLSINENDEWKTLSKELISNDQDLMRNKGKMAEELKQEGQELHNFSEHFSSLLSTISNLSPINSEQSKAQLMEKALIEAAKLRSSKRETDFLDLLATTFQIIFDSLENLDTKNKSQVKSATNQLESIGKQLPLLLKRSDKLPKELLEVSGKIALKAIKIAEELIHDKTTLEKLLPASVLLSRLSGRLSCNLAVISFLINKDLCNKEYLPEEGFLSELPHGFKYMIFGDPDLAPTSQFRKKAIDTEGDESKIADANEDCHIIFDPNRILIEDGNNKFIIDRYPMHPSKRSVAASNNLAEHRLQWYFSGGYRSEAFNNTGNIFVNENSEIAPLNCNYNGYHRNSYYSINQPGSNSVSSAATKELKDAAVDFKQEGFALAGNDRGELCIFRLLQHKTNSSKMLSTVLRLNHTATRYGYASHSKEVPVHVKGVFATNRLEGDYMKANVAMIGRTLIVHGKKGGHFWVIDSISGELLQIGSAGFKLNGIDRHGFQVVECLSNNRLKFVPFDLFTRYDALSRNEKENDSKTKTIQQVKDYGLLANDESYEESDDVQTTAEEEIKQESQKTEEKMDDNTGKGGDIDKKSQIISNEKKNRGKNISIDHLGLLLRQISGFTFSATMFTDKKNFNDFITKEDFFMQNNGVELSSTTFKELSKIIQFVSEFTNDKGYQPIFLYLLHILSEHLKRTYLIQSNDHESPKVITQTLAQEIKAGISKFQFEQTMELDMQYRTFCKLKAECLMILALLTRCPYKDDISSLERDLENIFTIAEQIDQGLISDWLEHIYKMTRDDPSTQATDSSLQTKLIKFITSTIKKSANLEHKMIDEFYCIYPNMIPNHLELRILAWNLQPIFGFLFRHWKTMDAKDLEAIIAVIEECSIDVFKALEKNGERILKDSSWNSKYNKELSMFLRYSTVTSGIWLLLDIVQKTESADFIERIRKFRCLALDKLCAFRSPVYCESQKNDYNINPSSDRQAQVKMLTIENHCKSDVQFNFNLRPFTNAPAILLEIYAREEKDGPIKHLGMLHSESKFKGYYEFYILSYIDGKWENSTSLKITVDRKKNPQACTSVLDQIFNVMMAQSIHRNVQVVVQRLF